MTFIIFVLLGYVIALGAYLSLLRRIKDKEIISNSFIYKLSGYIKRVVRYLHRQTKETILAVANIMVLFLSSFVLVRWLGFLGWIISFGIYIWVAHWYYKLAMERDYIIKGLEIIGGGNLDYQLDETRLHGKNRILGECINQVSKGLKVAVESSLVNEKMQAELITNISHDLKTPLTSIINYINLIQQENISKEEHDEYIQIISKKANRLKRLTEDVVEISRSASGKIDLEQQYLDMGELMPQLMVEWEDRFNQRNLDIRLEMKLKPAIVYADGRQTFRILENCFSNIDKYALENSRIYLTIEPVSLAMNREMVRITMKNISSSELNISPEALFDKFTRGNKARTGPSGSGLGLSIARNLARLQGGDMNIQIDGDLFKIILDLPMGRKEERSEQLESEVFRNDDIDRALAKELEELDKGN